MGDDGTRPRSPHGSGSPRRRPAGTSAVLTPPTGLPATDSAGGSARAPAPPPPSSPVGPPAPVVDPCVCRHARAAHEHWRRGTDCGVCGPDRCGRYRRRGGALRRFLRRLLPG